MTTTMMIMMNMGLKEDFVWVLRVFT